MLHNPTEQCQVLHLPFLLFQPSDQLDTRTSTLLVRHSYLGEQYKQRVHTLNVLLQLLNERWLHLKPPDRKIGIPLTHLHIQRFECVSLCLVGQAAVLRYFGCHDCKQKAGRHTCSLCRNLKFALVCRPKRKSLPTLRRICFRIASPLCNAIYAKNLQYMPSSPKRGSFCYIIDEIIVGECTNLI